MDLGEQVLERHRSEGWNRLDGYHDVELVIERLPEKVSAPCGDPGVLPPVEQAERVLRDVDDGDVVPTLGQGHRESSAASTGVHNTLPCFTHVSEQRGGAPQVVDDGACGSAPVLEGDQPGSVVVRTTKVKFVKSAALGLLDGFPKQEVCSAKAVEPRVGAAVLVSERALEAQSDDA